MKRILQRFLSLLVFLLYVVSGHANEIKLGDFKYKRPIDLSHFEDQKAMLWYEEDKGDYLLFWKNGFNFHGMIFDKKNIGELRLSIEKYLGWYKIAVKKNHNIGKMIMTFKPAKCYTTHEKEMSWGIANCGGESAVLFMTFDGSLQKHMYFFEFAAFTTESGKVSPGLMFLDFASVNHLKKLMSENHLQETLKIIKEYK